jgi:preprotein translocase subunit SecA
MGATSNQGATVPAVLNRLLSIGDGKFTRKLQSVTDQVNALAEDFTTMTDQQLRAMTTEFRDRLTAGETTDDLLPEAFALVREAADRVLGKRHYDVQVMGGVALHYGYVAEMKTGEGKTLVSTLPAYLNALSGKGVHVVTVNDYLAEVAAEQMGRIHAFLGLKVALLLPATEGADRVAAYAADITYGTNSEFGFDYLRDNMALTPAEVVQRGHHYAIVDEVDSILIDEARTPLIVSGPAPSNSSHYATFADLTDRMTLDEHYTVDLKKRTTAVTAAGVAFIEAELELDNLYAEQNAHLLLYLDSAVKAKELYTRDKDYIVSATGTVDIVDENTGRVMPDRRYNEGIHQALEAKEGVEVQAESQTFASVTLQNYFRVYDKLAGMTGTAMTEVAEFSTIYNLHAAAIPTHRPVMRIDWDDVLFRTEQEKFTAAVADVAKRYDAGQPVLIGTASVAKSEIVSRLLDEAGVPHQVLNAKHHEAEAAVIATAGRLKAVTVATNMAGRGTDIILGGNAETLAELELHERGLSPLDDLDEYEAAWAEVYPRLEAAAHAEREDVIAAGGLYVVATERHESRRIDNQLRGRAGRQGDPGESRFYVSLRDDLMTRFKADWVTWMLDKMVLPEGEPLANKRLAGSLAAAQAAVESQNYESRKDVLKYDDVLNAQRKIIYRERALVLAGVDFSADVDTMLREMTAKVVDMSYDPTGEGWNVPALVARLHMLGVTEATVEDIGEVVTNDVTVEEVTELSVSFVERVHGAYTEELGPDLAEVTARRGVLAAIDASWRQHLYAMDYLRSGIGLRSYAQKDPLVEYRSEAFAAFDKLLDDMPFQIVRAVFAYTRAEAASLLAERTAAAAAAGEVYVAKNLVLNNAPELPSRSDSDDGQDEDPPAGAADLEDERV